jgi:hypothetical protein
VQRFAKRPLAVEYLDTFAECNIMQAMSLKSCFLGQKDRSRLLFGSGHAPCKHSFADGYAAAVRHVSDKDRLTKFGITIFLGPSIADQLGNEQIGLKIGVAFAQERKKGVRFVGH